MSDLVALSIVTIILGPAQTNTYLIANEKTKEAVVIDPAWDGEKILSAAKQRGWQIGRIFLTHAHFDHIGGASVVASGFNPLLPVAMRNLVAAEVHTIGTTATRQCPRTRT